MVLLQTSPVINHRVPEWGPVHCGTAGAHLPLPPGFVGPGAKLITVNFVGKDSYVELASAKVGPRPNISLQVRPAPAEPLEGP